MEGLLWTKPGSRPRLIGQRKESRMAPQPLLFELLTTISGTTAQSATVGFLNLSGYSDQAVDDALEWMFRSGFVRITIGRAAGSRAVGVQLTDIGTRMLDYWNRNDAAHAHLLAAAYRLQRDVVIGTGQEPS
jgi:hypothetical protein